MEALPATLTSASEQPPLYDGTTRSIIGLLSELGFGYDQI
jgi:hypothetical protein